MTREQFLAAIYTDFEFRNRFIAAPRETALAAGLSQDDAEELARMDMESLRLAARNFERKRNAAVSAAGPAASRRRE